MSAQIEHRYPYIFCRGNNLDGTECWERDGCKRYVGLLDQHNPLPPATRVVSTMRRAFQARYSPCQERVDT